MDDIEEKYRREAILAAGKSGRHLFDGGKMFGKYLRDMDLEELQAAMAWTLRNPSMAMAVFDTVGKDELRQHMRSDFMAMAERSGEPRAGKPKKGFLGLW